MSHVTILYGGETWAFDFKTLNLKAADPNEFQIPEAPRRGAVASRRARLVLPRGLDHLGRWNEKVPQQFGPYLNVMRRLPNGSWRISHPMWDVDPSKNQ